MDLDNQGEIFSKHRRLIEASRQLKTQQREQQQQREAARELQRLERQRELDELRREERERRGTIKPVLPPMQLPRMPARPHSFALSTDARSYCTPCLELPTCMSPCAQTACLCCH